MDSTAREDERRSFVVVETRRTFMLLLLSFLPCVSQRETDLLQHYISAR
jgi:hypothetical protein